MSPIESDLLEVCRKLTCLERDLHYGVITTNDVRVILKTCIRLISKYF